MSADLSRMRMSRAVVPQPLRAWLGVVVGLAVLVVAAFGVGHAGDGEPGGAEGRLWRAVNGAQGPGRSVAHALDFWGEPAGAAALLAVVVAACLLLRQPRAAVFAVVATAAPVVATKLLKPVVGRTIYGDNLSYPSGHTAFFTAVALVAGLLVSGRLGLGRAAGALLVGILALAAGAAMGWAQVALGAHYPTDVLGGWCVALAVVPATGWLVDGAADRLAGRTPGRTAAPSSDQPPARTGNHPPANQPPAHTPARPANETTDETAAQATSEAITETANAPAGEAPDGPAGASTRVDR
ncbi:phosphatase PAP2 family protein [Streptomyces sp. 796.1]|uniref:phosphatase PAP2 family protein n=1 Tax=Streptomyces sp. 796.1 TaxID=3163029 RepID=UPI0039C9D542